MSAECCEDLQETNSLGWWEKLHKAEDSKQGFELVIM